MEIGTHPEVGPPPFRGRQGQRFCQIGLELLDAGVGVDETTCIVRAVADRLLVALGDETVAAPGWHIVRQPRSVAGAVAGFSQAVAMKADTVGCWDTRLGPPSEALIREFERSRAHIWHGGLHLGLSGAGRLIPAVAPATWLSLDMPPGIECSSWRLSLRASFLRGTVLRQGLATLDTRFRGLEAAGLDWGLRLLRAGIVLRHHPALVGCDRPKLFEPLSIDDELRLVTNGFGLKWGLWAAIASRRHLGIRRRTALRTIRRFGAPLPRPASCLGVPTAGANSTAGQVECVSVVIPSLDRPRHLSSLLDQLAAQTRRPDEVIVADQSRRVAEDVVEQPQRTDDLPLTVLHLSVSGQSHARNAAIRATSGDLIVFLDDDEEVPADLIERHLAAIAATGADAIAGGVDVPGQTAAERATWMRSADTFPGGHSSVLRTALARSGLFDPVFDQGPRADADLGTRLALSGALVLYAPSIRIVHHHAQEGGLRTIGARSVTRASSRSSLTQRNLPSATQLYLGLRHWGEEEVRTSIVLLLLSGIRRDGSRPQAILRALAQMILMPGSVWRVRRRLAEAHELLEARPSIPELA